MSRGSGESVGARLSYGPVIRAVACWIVAASMLAACAGSVGQSAPSRSPTGMVSPASTKLGQATKATVKRTAFAHPSLFPTATPAGVEPTQPAGTRKAPLEITMGSLCVLPGETQTITIRSTPRYHVVFATMWPDQQDHPEWGAMVIPTADTRIGPDGSYTKSWIVPPHAPRGAARTDVSVSGISNNVAYQSQAWAFWEIATKC